MPSTRKGTSERLMEELIASKTGKKVTYHKLEDLGNLWNGLPRAKPLSESRIANNLHVAAEFANFCKCEYIYEVTEKDVKGFLDWLKAQGSDHRYAVNGPKYTLFTYPFNHTYKMPMAMSTATRQPAQPSAISAICRVSK